MKKALQFLKAFSESNNQYSRSYQSPNIVWGFTNNWPNLRGVTSRSTQFTWFFVKVFKLSGKPCLRHITVCLSYSYQLAVFMAINRLGENFTLIQNICFTLSGQTVRFYLLVSSNLTHYMCVNLFKTRCALPGWRQIKDEAKHFVAYFIVIAF